MEQDDGKVDWVEQSGKAVAAGVGAAAGWLSQGPAGAVGGAMGGSLLEPPAVWMFQRIGQAMQRRRQKVMDVASETVGLSPEELYKQISENEKQQVLAVKAIEAASRTAWEEKVRTLGRSLAAGVLSSDEAKFSTEELIMAAVADMQESHLALLDVLVAWPPGDRSGFRPVARLPDIPEYSHSQRSDRTWSVGERRWYVHLIKIFRPQFNPILPALIGTLQAHGLVTYESNAGDSSAIHDQPYDPGLQRPYVEPTELGELVWIRFDGAGAKAPYVSTAPAAASED